MNWPAHRLEDRPWKSAGRHGSRADRTLTSITVAIPPMLADLDYDPTGPVARRHEAALIAIARLEAGHGQHLAPLSDFLLRSESVASSKIEHIDADWRAFSKAFAGGKASEAARSQLAAARALTAMIETANNHPVTLEALLEAHRVLMDPDPYADAPGALRTVQNWIGGSDHSPLDAAFVPPPPDLVPDLVDDLLRFAARNDLPVLAKAAIAHAQFESIHPFVDGNGRLGRALISAILRHSALTDRITVPLASVMLANTDDYFQRLTRYRAGEVDQFVEYVAAAAIHASEASAESAIRLAALPDKWRQAARPRTNSAEASLIDALLDTPIMNADNARRITGTSETSTYNALAGLTAAGVLEVISESTRYRIWAATDVLAELSDLNATIGKRATEAKR